MALRHLTAVCGSGPSPRPADSLGGSASAAHTSGGPGQLPRGPSFQNIHTYTHMHVCTYTHTYVCYTHAYTYMCVYICTYVHTCTYTICACMHMQACTCTCARSHMHGRMYMHIHTYVCAYIIFKTNSLYNNYEVQVIYSLKKCPQNLSHCKKTYATNTVCYKHRGI